MGYRIRNADQTHSATGMHLRLSGVVKLTLKPLLGQNKSVPLATARRRGPCSQNSGTTGERKLLIFRRHQKQEGPLCRVACSVSVPAMALPNRYTVVMLPNGTPSLFCRTAYRCCAPKRPTAETLDTCRSNAIIKEYRCA